MHVMVSVLFLCLYNSTTREWLPYSHFNCTCPYITPAACLSFHCMQMLLHLKSAHMAAFGHVFIMNMVFIHIQIPLALVLWDKRVRVLYSYYCVYLCTLAWFALYLQT